MLTNDSPLSPTHLCTGFRKNLNESTNTRGVSRAGILFLNPKGDRLLEHTPRSTNHPSNDGYLSSHFPSREGRSSIANITTNNNSCRILNVSNSKFSILNF